MALYRELKIATSDVIPADRFADFLSSLNLEYIVSKQRYSDTEFKEAWLGFGIVKALLENTDILKYASLSSKKELLESIELHKDRHIETLQKEEDLPEMSSTFKSNVDILIDRLNYSFNTPRVSYDSELDTTGELATNLVRYCQILFEGEDRKAINRLQALSIACSIKELSSLQQLELADKLLLVRELWQLINTKSGHENNLKFLVHSNLPQLLRNLEVSGVDQAVDKIIRLCVKEYHVLSVVPSEQLITLYDRLRKIELKNTTILNLLYDIHYEAQFRYGHVQINSADYELNKRFESYDAISHQIEHSEFIIAESFLLKGFNNYCHEVLLALVKHIDSIKAVEAATLEGLKFILSQIELNASQHKEQSRKRINMMLSSIKQKLSLEPDDSLLKKYSGLDNFTAFALREQYFTLFNNIRCLFDRSDKANKFLQNVITRRLAQDYQATNNVESVNKLRLLTQERTQIARQLCEINFIEVFHPNNDNMISGLSFRKRLINAKIKTPLDYIKRLIRILLSNCNNLQLEIMYDSLVQRDFLNETRNLIKRELSSQVISRTGIAKMIYSWLTGKKSEFDKLVNIRKKLLEAAGTDTVPDKA